MSATDPLVATFEHAVYDLGNADQNGPTAADVLRCGRDMRAKRARLSAVLAAAREVAAAYSGPGLAGRDYDPDEVAARVCDLCNALTAADGAA